MAWYDQLFTDLRGLAAAVAGDVKAILPRLLPAGGTAGQVLTKSSSTNYAVGWTTVAGGGGGVAFSAVASYPDLVALGTPGVLTFVLVNSDSKQVGTNTTYQLWPNGVRRLLASSPDNAVTDYSGVGVVISDGGGSFQNDSSRNPEKVFDGLTSTFYDAINNQAGKFVGRNLGSPRTLNRVNITPRQDVQYASQINNGQFQYSTDGTNWTTIYTVTGVTNGSGGNYTQMITVNFLPTTAQYWRLYWPGGGSFGNVSEIQLLYTN